MCFLRFDLFLLSQKKKLKVQRVPEVKFNLIVRIILILVLSFPNYLLLSQFAAPTTQ
jgi:hypothetical protein